MSTSYFMQNNEWPTIGQDMGFNDRLFEDHDSIEGLKLGLDGTIRLLLKDEVFGPSRVLELTPDIDAYLAGSSLNLRWDCLSNLQPEMLPDVCKSM